MVRTSLHGLMVAQAEGTARVGRDIVRALAAAGHRVSFFYYDADPLWVRAVPKSRAISPQNVAASDG
jgi:hypothetical protein